MVKSKHTQRKLAAKLEELAENVSKRGVYLPVKSGDNYMIVEYLTKNTVIDSLPNRDIAERMSARMNMHKEISASKIQKIKDKVYQYQKHNHDAMFFSNTIANTTDDLRRDVAWFRLDLAKHNMRKLQQDLERI